MTDKQIRDRIVGVLSASMMPMELEAECVTFLDRCLKLMSWHPAGELPPLHMERYELEKEVLEFETSEPVLVFTEDNEMAVIRCTREDAQIYWADRDGAEYEVTHWMPIPEPPKGAV